MSWRIVVITGVAKLDLKMGFLVVRKESTTRIHLSEIHTVMIESTAVSVTTALLSELINRKVKVIFCDEKCNPAGELLPYRGSHDTSLKVKTQIQWTELLKEQIWTEIVAEKIRQQRQILFFIKRMDEAELLTGYLGELELGDKTNREGHAAKVYFNALFGKEFTRTEDCVTNAALNYGYTLLLSTFNREIAANGYFTQIGLFHDNRFNPFNLSSDLMEPFRPIVDFFVYQTGFHELGHEEKMQLADLLNKDVMISGKTQKLHYAIKVYCKSVLDALNEQDITKIQFYNNEL